MNDLSQQIVELVIKQAYLTFKKGNMMIFRRSLGYFIILFLLPLSFWVANLFSARIHPCNKGIGNTFSLNGLAEHVEIAVENKYPKKQFDISVAQSGCDIDFRGKDVTESNKDNLKRIAKEDVKVETDQGNLNPVKDVTFSELEILKVGDTDSARIRELEISQYKYQITLNTIWVLVAGSLVFFMNAGFAALETGFCRFKNSKTILAKNLVVFSIVAIVFWALGFGVMFGKGNPIFGSSGFFLISYAENSPTIGNAYKGVFESLNQAAIPLSTKFFFQLTFASTAATIISGAVAERIKFKSFFLFVPLFTIFVYAVVGHWIWGGGWLSKLHFWDFAGSTTVHSVGGMAGLIGTWILKPRLDRYRSGVGGALPDFRGRTCRGNRIYPFKAYSLSLSTLGCLILWLGWFGFNAGSTLEANSTAISHVLLNTALAGSTGSLGSLIGAWIYFEKPSIAFLINGILGGCVSITASCAFVGLPSAAIIGFIGGILVNFVTVLLEKIEIDDPVGAIPVHLGCGIWGTIAVGLFSEGANIYSKYGLYPKYDQNNLEIPVGPDIGILLGGSFWESLWPQIIGILTVAIYVILVSWVLWKLIGLISGGDLRISRIDERKGINREFWDS
ncbi:ammonium transporter [filamentous cyanobacterium LEGE 11480]|uniref:Ammonium transporter n=1 Tax=Romeriopsis navalis LEGE 11480 TaxID=2777977 RepID=A0A928VUD5_9CYAN|nr:ammonium transporter [Romeriopsis navalis]MBE9032244.1 ammonium transporter [Romeriopsis navalis LEGE 11480]